MSERRKRKPWDARAGTYPERAVERAGLDEEREDVLHAVVHRPALGVVPRALPVEPAVVQHRASGQRPRQCL